MDSLIVLQRALRSRYDLCELMGLVVSIVKDNDCSASAKALVDEGMVEEDYTYGTMRAVVKKMIKDFQFLRRMEDKG